MFRCYCKQSDGGSVAKRVKLHLTLLKTSSVIAKPTSLSKQESGISGVALALVTAECSEASKH